MSKHKAGGGKASQHVNPKGKRLGVKVTDGQKVGIGEVLIRQRGLKYKAGGGTKVGRDFTVFSINEGIVKFGKKLGKKFISVISK